MSDYIQSGIRTRINAEHAKLTRATEQLIQCDRANKFRREMLTDYLKRREGIIEGMELALKIVQERSCTS